MKYIRKNGIKDPGSAITHGIALILAVVGTLPLLLKAAREPDHLHKLSAFSGRSNSPKTAEPLPDIEA